ncbi:transgelin-2-like isoform X1 [Gigantopelta aegis]|uniref:transgelin-2-like isoform X1 n=1 Tax=Gigantopelta aegis TaxID=1735272 RepID=UPI001B88D691|nr:transgelin-2-like isoform X1 [Gigantopelta aegis]
MGLLRHVTSRSLQVISVLLKNTGLTSSDLHFRTVCFPSSSYPSPQTSTMTEKVRASKSGLGYEIEKKMENNYDKEEAAGTPEAIRVWINAIVEGIHETAASSHQADLHKWLKDGICLCKLINKLLESDGKGKISYQKKVANSFVGMANIQAYNDGCEKYGLPKESLFQSVDLWEGRKGPFLNVINGLHSLGCLANSKGYEVTYTGVQNPTVDNS